MRNLAVTVILAVAAALLLVRPWPGREPPALGGPVGGAAPPAPAGAALDGSEDLATPAKTLGPVLPQVPSPAVLTATPAPPPVAVAGYEPMTFGTLAGYEYILPATLEELLAMDQVPEDVRALHGRKVAVSGFMLPLDMTAKGTEAFLLVKDQLACCFGKTPRMNDWVYVGSAERVPVVMDRPITVAGTLEVGEDVQDGQVLSLYRLQADEVVEMAGAAP